MRELWLPDGAEVIREDIEAFLGTVVGVEGVLMSMAMAFDYDGCESICHQLNFLSDGLMRAESDFRRGVEAEASRVS